MCQQDSLPEIQTPQQLQQQLFLEGTAALSSLAPFSPVEGFFCTVTQKHDEDGSEWLVPPPSADETEVELTLEHQLAQQQQYEEELQREREQQLKQVLKLKQLHQQRERERMRVSQTAPRTLNDEPSPEAVPVQNFCYLRQEHQPIYSIALPGSSPMTFSSFALSSSNASFHSSYAGLWEMGNGPNPTPSASSVPIASALGHPLSLSTSSLPTYRSETTSPLRPSSSPSSPCFCARQSHSFSGPSSTVPSNSSNPSSLRTQSPSLTPSISKDKKSGHKRHKKHKRGASSSSSSSSGLNKPTIRRTAKNRLIWSKELHSLFLKCLKSIEANGVEATPKAILSAMNVKGITRENVSSHLQKYRQKQIPIEQLQNLKPLN